jgi:protein-S-isoprenylcysteine O-methyltransferase Ste14
MSGVLAKRGAPRFEMTIFYVGGLADADPLNRPVPFRATYRRHPINIGLILAMLATGTAVATAASLLGAPLISFGQWQKARMEERFLIAELGPEAYESYRHRVPMIVPLLRL